MSDTMNALMVAPQQPAPEPTDQTWPGDETELLTRLVGYFEDAESQSREAREAAERDRDYYSGKQWTAEEIAVLNRRKQPPITNNYVRRKIDLLCGLERRARTDPKAYPRTPHEDDRANAMTQALRFVADDTNFDVTRSAVHENMAIEGFGGAETVVTETQQGLNIDVNQIPWDRIFFDPHSAAKDFADARYMGKVIWQDKEEALDDYPDAADVLESTLGMAALSTTFDDKPGHVSWCDNKRSRVRVVQIHWRKARDWWTATFTRSGFLAPPRLSGYLDRDGNQRCPMRLGAVYVDRDNNRSGIVRDLISPQDSINKRESKLLHLISVRQVHYEDGAVEDEDVMRRELAKPDGAIKTNPSFKFEVLPTGDMSAGQMQMLQYSVQQMNAAGPNAAMAGNDPRDQSGRAIMAQQNGGAVQNEHLADALRQWTRAIFEDVAMCVRQFWTEEKWIRTTDEEKNVKFVGLNRKITLADELATMPDEPRAMAMQQMGLVPGDPRLQQVIRVENEIGDLDVDITIEEGPDIPMLQSEQFKMLSDLASSGMVQLPPEVLIKASALRNKDELLKMLEKAQQSAAQQQQAQAPIMQARAEAEVRKTTADAALKEAGAAGKQAETVERMHTMAIHPSTPGPSVGPMPDGSVGVMPPQVAG